MRPRATSRHAAPLLVALACLAACAQPTSTGQPSFTSFQVLRTSAFPSNHIAPFEATSSDAAKVRRFYQTLLALPAPSSGTVHCPADFGVVYQLTFYAGSAASAKASVEASGCGFVKVGSVTRWWLPSQSFWQQFADTLGVSEAALYPVTPQPSGPSAPTPAP